MIHDPLLAEEPSGSIEMEIILPELVYVPERDEVILQERRRVLSKPFPTRRT